MKTSAPHRIIAVVTLCLLTATILAASSPERIAETASVAELESAIRRQTDLLTEYLEKPENYQDNLTRDKIGQAGAAIACLAQAVADHPQAAQATVQVPHLREAGQQVVDSESFEGAVAGLKSVEQALAGKAEGSPAARENWDELIPLGRGMEELNRLMGKLRRSVRRSREPEQDALDATTAAVLSLVTKADTSYVLEDADLPEWQKYSDEMYGEFAAIAKAIKAGDSETAQAHHKTVATLCTKCHDKFRE